METLNKIKFFVTHINMNLNEFKVDIESGIFYNIEKNEVYEVMKNSISNQYEIYKGQELVYGKLSQDDNKNLEKDSRQYQPKVRKLIKPKSSIYNNAAFTKIGFLIINIITFTLLILMIIFLNK